MVAFYLDAQSPWQEGRYPDGLDALKRQCSRAKV
jgi:hypothetical protein